MSTETHPFFNHHQPPEGRDVAPFCTRSQKYDSYSTGLALDRVRNSRQPLIAFL